MENRLKCVVLLSLREMTLRRVAVLLSKDWNICVPLYSGGSWKTWLKEFDETVKIKVTKLQLPGLLRNEIIAKVRPISLEIREWILYHQSIVMTDISFPEKLCWTNSATINHEKTAKALLGSKKLNVGKLYEIACYHCLEDFIPIIWDNFIEPRKRWYYNQGVRPHLEFCWPHILKGEFSVLNHLWRTSARDLTSFNQWAFEDSATKGNKSATEYFYRKLSYEEREVSVLRTTLDVLRKSDMYERHCLSARFIEVLLYLIPCLTPEQQMETIRMEPIAVLLCFSKMYWQDLFLENSGLIWPFVPTTSYRDLIKKIFDTANSDRCFLVSFPEFFLTSPRAFKSHFVNHQEENSSTSASIFLNIFFASEEVESIKAIFRNIDDTDRKELPFHPKVSRIFFRNIVNGRGHLVKDCLQEAQLSKEEKERLTIIFQHSAELHSFTTIERQNLKKFLKFLNEPREITNEVKKGQKRKLNEVC